MKLRIASLLLTLALPLAAQDPAAAEADMMFYKAYYLEKGERDFASAIALYEQFLAKAPDHKHAATAARNNLDLLTNTGKLKERDAFKAKYEKLLGNAANAPVPASGERGERGARGGEGRGEAGGRGERPAGGGGRPDPAARLAELEKQLATAKEEGNEERVKELEAQLARARQAGRGERGAGGQGGRRGGLMGALMGNKKVGDMTADEITQLKEGLANYTISERMKQGMTEEQVKKIETNVDSLKKALDANKTEDAQKALDGLREAFPRGRGRGGEAGGNNRGGGGGNNRGGGGGGGTNGGGGGGR